MLGGDKYEKVFDAEEITTIRNSIKDFSYDEHSGVSPKHRGKFLAFTEHNTTLDNAGKVKTCVAHLKELGVTHVHLLPSYDYGSINEIGDDPQAYGIL